MNPTRCIALLLLLALAGVLAIWPIGVGLTSAARFLLSSNQLPDALSIYTLSSFGRTLIFPALIAGIATLLAIPAAWSLRTPSRLGIFLALPLVLPSYLVYASWSLLRAPRTPLGDLLASAPPSLITTANHTIAIWGLVLWSWPIAALVLLPAVRNVPQDQLDALRLMTPSRLRRWRVLLGAVRTQLLVAFGLVFTLMLSSAIPLHIAGVRTWAIEVWQGLNLSPTPGPVWVAALPLLAVALIAAILLRLALTHRWVQTPPTTPSPAQANGSSRRIYLPALLIVSAIVPLVLFAQSIKHPGEDWQLGFFLHRLGGFFTDPDQGGQAALSSLVVGGWVGVVCALICVTSWYIFASLRHSSRPFRVVFDVVFVSFVTLGLTPGVLVGLAGSQLLNMPPLYLGEILPILTIHLMRFGYIPLIAGVVLAQLEPGVLRDAAALQPTDRPIARWWRTQGLARWPAVAGVGLAGMMLSIHEIEATVIVVPPGRDVLAQQLLNDLHFAWDLRLATASVVLIGVGLVAAWGVGMLWSHATRRAEDAV